jgi:ligand-binding sensor domain-containing protein
MMACLLSAAHALDPHRKISQYVREKWSAANGLPGGAVHAIAQSPDGYLWIGTDKGLVRFDGFTFLPVPPKSLLPQNDPILGLITDAEGDLWVRMQTAGILRYNRGKFKNLASGPNATVTQVTAIARENAAGMLLSDLISGTLRLRRGKLDLVAPANILPGAAPTMSIAETAGGKIWLGTLGAGLFYLANGRATRVTQGLTETKINCLLPVGDQELWVGTDHGLFRWSGMGFRRAELGPSLRDQQCWLFFAIAIRTSGWVLREVFCESMRVVLPLLSNRACSEPVLSTRCLRIAKEVCGLGVPRA